MTVTLCDTCKMGPRCDLGCMVQFKDGILIRCNNYEVVEDCNNCGISTEPGPISTLICSVCRNHDRWEAKDET